MNFIKENWVKVFLVIGVFVASYFMFFVDSSSEKNQEVEEGDKEEQRNAHKNN